ncbi:hypothetical protein AB0K21_22015 [Streptosporangium sp. NPDC049248]|uniref:hypothetical protein n=1 Tax=Streptosporangium sp. NPDC049248 TaxID=3155651 RepID=UPI0034238C3A
MEPVSSLSRPYVYITIKGASGSEQVEIAFTNPGAEPEESDWWPAEWASSSGGGVRARILIGPGSDVILVDGTYMAWARVTGAVERPVLPAGLVPIS